MSGTGGLETNGPESRPAELDVPNVGRQVLVLVLIYLVVSLLHVWALDDASRFPHISSDEVQYALTGENIRAGRGFTLRGELNTSSPPLFPLFVAAAYSLGRDQPRKSMLIASSFVMSLAVFIAFPLARYLGVRRACAYVLAAAVGMSPHTFYAGTHMTEILQYPLFLGSFYVSLLWINRPTLRRGIGLGTLLAAAVSVKLQTVHLLLGLLVTVIAATGQAARHSKREALALLNQSLVVFGIVAAAFGSWVVFKQSLGGQALGIYRDAAAGGLPFWSAPLMLAYVADFVLAPGLVTVVPLCWWFRDSRSFRTSAFCGAVLLIEFGAVSIVDGGLTGWLRERLYMYSLPIMAILSVAGLTAVRWPLTRLRVTLLPAVPLAVLPLLALYPFHISPVIETPWASALGAYSGVTMGTFSRGQLLGVTPVLICLVSYLMIRVRHAAPLCLSVFVLIFYSFSFWGAALGMARWSTTSLTVMAPVLDWLHRNDVDAGDRLLVTANPSYFQFEARRWSADEAYVEWNRNAGLTEVFIWQLELLGRFDVRTLPDLRFLPEMSQPGDVLLTAAQLDGLEAIDTRFPLSLYRIGQNPVALPHMLYELDIPARVFATQVGERTPSELIAGDGSGDNGFLVYGPYLPILTGTYEVKFNIVGDPEMPITLDVYEHPDRTVAREAVTIGDLGVLTFTTSGASALEYRVFGEDDADFRFLGVTLRYVSGPWLKQ